MDPLAEQFPAWNPYHYVHNNPINLVDPTGMIGEDWVEHATDKGDKLLTYDPFVHSEQDAIDRGYRNVKGVSETMSYNGTSGTESYNLNANGSVTDNLNGTTTDVGFNAIRTSDGFYISENNQLKALSSGLQEAGDWVSVTGLAVSATGVGAPLGSAMITIGGGMSLVGTGIESRYLWNQGEKQKSLTKIGMTFAFMGTGALGTRAAQKAIGTSLNTRTEALIGGINMAAEKTIGTDTEKWLNKK